MATIGARSTGGTGGFPRGLAIGGIVVVIVVMIIAVVAALAALNRGSSSTTDTPSAQAPAVANTGQQTAANSGQTSGGDFKRPAGAVRIGDTLLSGVSVRTLDVRPAESHLKYVAIEVTVQNTGARPQEVGTFKLKDSDGVSAVEAGSDAELANQLKGLRGEIVNLWGTTIAPGETIRGTVVFKVLTDTTPAVLQYVSDARDMGIVKLQ